jgi:hypothetical protein
MSDGFPRGAVPVSILAGALWIARPAASFRYVEAVVGEIPYGIGFIFAVIVGGLGGDLLVGILAIAVLLTVSKGSEPFGRSDRLVQFAAVAGAGFLLLVLPLDDVVAGLVPRPQYEAVFRAILIGRSVCAAALIGSVLLGTALSRVSASASSS